MKKITSVLAVVLSASLVYAGATDIGWKYGRNNCGPMTPGGGARSLAACVACCGSLTNNLNPAQVADCSAYCACAFPTKVYTNPLWVTIFA